MAGDFEIFLGETYTLFCQPEEVRRLGQERTTLSSGTRCACPRARLPRWPTAAAQRAATRSIQRLASPHGPLQAPASSAFPSTQKESCLHSLPTPPPQPFQCHGLCPTRVGTRGRHVARDKGPAQPTSRGRSAAPTRLSLTRKQWSAPECEASPFPNDTHSPGELLRPRALNTVYRLTGPPACTAAAPPAS